MSRVRTYLGGLSRAFVTGAGAVPETDASLYGYFGADESTPDYGDYIRTSNAVYVAARLRSQLLASLPLKLYRVRPDGKRDEVTSGPLVELLTKVNPHWTMQRLVEMTELSLCLWGSAYVFLDRGTSGRQPPRELWWARPDRVTVVPDKVNYISHFLYDVGDGKDPLRFERDEVLWFRYPNPLDEFDGLSPLASAAIAADTSRAAMVSNAMMFRNGLQLAGVVQPANGVPLSEEQALSLERAMARRFKGADSAHRWGILRFEAKFQPLSVTPKDAEFLGSLKWGLEEICRAYGVPLDLVGGERTYANQHDARLAIWTDTILPEARFLATELTEQLLPLFPGAADLVEFDASGVPVLQEAEAAKWEIEKQKLDAGVMLPNEWRTSKGLDPVAWGDAWWAPTAGGGVGPVVGALPPIAPNAQIAFGGLTVNELRLSQGLEAVPWGDVWWAPAGTVPVASNSLPDAPPPSLPPTPADEDTDPNDDPDDGPDELQEARSGARAHRSSYGSPDHVARWTAHVRAVEPDEKKVAEATADLMRRQRQAVLARLNQRGARSLDDVALDPFDLPRWIRTFRVVLRPLIREIVERSGSEALREVGGVGLAFDLRDPRVIEFLETQVQRFATQVNQTTWDRLKAEIGAGIDAGEGIDAIAGRIETVMGDRIASTPEAIARTEVGNAVNGGQLEGWRQSGVVVGKRWLAAIDDRTRPTHIAAHDQVVGIDENFTVGSATGPHPSAMSSAAESVNCRCTMVPVLDTDEGA